MAEENLPLKPSVDEILVSIRQLISEKDMSGDIQTSVDSTKAESSSNHTGMSDHDVPPVDEAAALSPAAGGNLQGSLAEDPDLPPSTESADENVYQLTEDLIVSDTDISSEDGEEVLRNISFDAREDLDSGKGAESPQNMTEITPGYTDYGSGGSVSGGQVEESVPRDTGKKLVNADTERAVRKAFENLTALNEQSRSASLEDTVKTMLQPMIMYWLDQNLPDIVEKLIDAEIKRLANNK